MQDQNDTPQWTSYFTSCLSNFFFYLLLSTCRIWQRHKFAGAMSLQASAWSMIWGEGLSFLRSKSIFMATLLTLRTMPSFFCLTACFQIFLLRFCCRYHLQEYVSRVSLTSTKKAMKVVNFCDQHGFTQQGNIILDFAWELLLIEFFFLFCLHIILENVFHIETKNNNNRKNKKKGTHVGRSNSVLLASVYLFTLT